MVKRLVEDNIWERGLRIISEKQVRFMAVAKIVPVIWFHNIIKRMRHWCIGRILLYGIVWDCGLVFVPGFDFDVVELDFGEGVDECRCQPGVGEQRDVEVD